MKPSREAVRIMDSLVLLYAISVLAGLHLNSITLLLVAGTVLGMVAVAAHNFFHKKDNWRVYYFDLSPLSSYEWRISHAYSHHLFPNTVLVIKSIKKQYQSVSLYVCINFLVAVGLWNTNGGACSGDASNKTKVFPPQIYCTTHNWRTLCPIWAWAGPNASSFFFTRKTKVACGKFVGYFWVDDFHLPVSHHNGKSKYPFKIICDCMIWCMQWKPNWLIDWNYELDGCDLFVDLLVCVCVKQLGSSSSAMLPWWRWIKARARLWVKSA